MANGFIVINRRIEDWQWWGNIYAMAIWLYIIEKANWKDGYWSVTGEEVPRGSFITSKRKIAADLDINKRTVDRWLTRFQNARQIDVKVTSRSTMITVINYAKYQGIANEGAPLDAPLDAPPSAHNRTKKQSNKETKKPINTQESVRASFAPPSLEEVDQYINAKGYHFTADEFVSFYESIGWKVGRNPMENWKAACTTWENRRMKSQPSAQRQQPKKAKTFLDMLEEEDRNEQKTDT